MSAFPASEYRKRLDRAYSALGEAGMEAAICVAPETIFYLSGYEGYTYWTEQALVLSADGTDPTLILRDTDLPLADENGEVEDVRVYHYSRDDPVDMIWESLREKGVTNGAIGVEMQSYSFPGSYFERLGSRAPGGVALADCSRLMSRLRVIKSPAELEYVRQASVMTRAGMNAAVEATKHGTSEIAVASAVEGALRRAGSDYSAMPTMVGSGPRSVAVHATPTHRVIENGEPVVIWYAGVCRRYHVTAYRTIHVGPPSPGFGKFYEIAENALGILVDHVKVGEAVAQAARAASGALREEGFDRYHIARWGYGVGIAYPPVWLEAFDVIEESDDTFEPGMLMCLHICFSVPESRFGMYVGGDYLLTGTRLEPLDEMGTNLVVV